MNDSGCEPVFIISVAARLLAMHPQTLRKYEREGLIAPSRTTGNLRLYSDDDLERQRAYVQHGWNVTGDSYVVDADGYFWYQARTDDMIISGGYNIAGPEVEGVLLKPVGYTAGRRYPTLVVAHGGPAGAYTNNYRVGGLEGRYATRLAAEALMS